MLNRTLAACMVAAVLAAPVAAQRDGPPAPPVVTEAAPTDTPMGLEAWLASEMAADLDLNGVVDESDYRQWEAAGGGPILIAPAPGEVAGDGDGQPEPVVLPRTAEAYVVWEYAADLNADGTVDTADFDLWLALHSATEPGVLPEVDTGLSYEAWLELYAMDMNADGRVDQADYEEFQAHPILIMPTAVRASSWGAVKGSTVH